MSRILMKLWSKQTRCLICSEDCAYRQRENSGLRASTDSHLFSECIKVSKGSEDTWTLRVCVSVCGCACTPQYAGMVRWSVVFFSCVAGVQQQQQTCGAARLFTHGPESVRQAVRPFFSGRKYICAHTWTRTHASTPWSTSGLVLDTAAAPPVTHRDFARGSAVLSRAKNATTCFAVFIARQGWFFHTLSSKNITCVQWKPLLQHHEWRRKMMLIFVCCKKQTWSMHCSGVVVVRF